MTPATHYAEHKGVHIAYQVLGNGERDLIYLPGLWSHVEHVWRDPSYSRFLQGLAVFSRLIMLDTRGAGLSDRASGVPLLEDQIDDVLSVMDAVSSDSATVMGVSQSGPLATLMAATHPARVDGLILYGSYATSRATEDSPSGRSEDWLAEYIERVDREWGSATDLDLVAPSMAGNRAFRDWWAQLERYSNPPGDAMAYIRSHSDDDVRAVLPTVSVPTLVIHRSDDPYRPIGLGRYFAEQISNARMVELEGRDHLPYLGDTRAILEAVEQFVTGSTGTIGSDRVLATLLFTDIVDSTARAAELGDREWRGLLHRHNQTFRDELSRFRGREVKTTGDGFLAIFDGPARAIECAIAIRDELHNLGVDIRAGIHTGEVELIGSDIGGISVHIGSRVSAMANAGEVLVSRTVRDLVAGSGIQFEDRGTHVLKGVPDDWQLFAVFRLT